MAYVKKTDNPKIGRPPKIIDWKKVEALATIQATQEEICAVMDVHSDTLTDSCRKEFGVGFSEMFKKWREGGRSSLRRAQWTKALEGHPTMLIWMGKQVLGQKDQIETTAVEPIKLGYDPSKLPDEK
jgi:hypothetical protein